MKKLLSLFVLLVAIVTGAKADDYVLTASSCASSTTFTVDGKVFTLSPAHGGTGQTGYGDYIKFSKNKTYTLALPEGFQLTNINVKGYTNSNGKTNGELTSVAGIAQTGKTFPAKDDGNLGSAEQITAGYDFAVSQTGGSIVFVTANTNQICVLITLTGTAAAETQVATPTFSPEETNFATETLDVTLSCLTSDATIQYSTDGGTTWNDYSDPFTIDATTTIQAKATKSGLEDSEVASKTYTKVVATTVYDGSGVENGTLSLEKSNVTDAENAYFTVTSPTWSSKTWSGYEGDYLDMKTGRKISVTVKNVENFEFYLSGSKDRTFTVKVGDGDAVEYSQSSSSGFVSPGVISTGTTDEVTITIEGGANTLYPVYMVVNRPTSSITLNASGFATYSSGKDFSFSGAKAYGMELTSTALVGTEATGKIKAGEGVLFKGEAGATVTIAETDGATALENNSLIGTTSKDEEIITTDYTYKYALSGDTFKTFTGSLQKNKAFFGSDTAMGNSLEMIFEEGEATAVEAVAEANANNAGVKKFFKNGQLVIETANGVFTAAGAQVK